MEKSKDCGNYSQKISFAHSCKTLIKLSTMRVCGRSPEHMIMAVGYITLRYGTAADAGTGSTHTHETHIDINV